MTSEWPKFKVFAVKDGGAYGLLVRRQMSRDQPEEQRYFWFSDGEGLAPTREIMQACDRCHELRHSLYEKRLVKELVDYASAVSQTGNMTVVKSVAVKYRDTKGFQGLVDHFFERVNSPLRDFFRDADTFKTKVLAKVRRKDEIVGMAVEFGILSPHCVAISGLDYVKPLEVVLELANEQPEWFRRQGSIAVDFDNNRIYPRRKLLEDLNKLVLNNSFSMLEGIDATGKTTIVRQFGYGLHKLRKLAVFHFDCARDKDFDKDKLIKEINSTKGVIILENIHLVTQKLQRVYACIEPNPNRHILFTARPSFRKRETRRDRLLSAVKTIELEPFDEVDAIIDYYASCHPKLPWPENARESIKNVSKKSFWLLGYALKGYVDLKGKGEPKTWLAAGVRDDLEELEKEKSHFPEVLVALSPLYINEVLTDEIYLTKVLSFDLPVLNELVCRGEITRQDAQDGHIFYGLPHSAQAEAYWEHGMKYRIRAEIPEFDDFIYKYATSKLPNGLTAILHSKPERMVSLLLRLCDEGKITEVVAIEQSLSAIAYWADHAAKYDRLGRKCLRNSQLLKTLAKKMDKEDNLMGVTFCLCDIYSCDKKAGKELWQLLNQRKLADKLSMADDVENVSWCIECIGTECKEIGTQLCEAINLKELADRMQERTAKDMCDYLSAITSANKQCGERFWNILDHTQLVTKLAATEEIAEIIKNIANIFEADKGIGWKLWRLLDIQRLANSLSRPKDPIGAAFALLDLDLECSWAARKLCYLLDMQQLEKELQHHEMCDAATYIASIQTVNPLIDNRLWNSLDIKELAHNLIHVDISDLRSCIDAICRASLKKWKQLCNILVCPEFANRLSQEKHPPDAAGCIWQIYKASPEAGSKLCEMLDKQVLANKLAIQKSVFRMDDFTSLSPQIFLDLLKKVNKDFCSELRKLVDERFSTAKSIAGS